VSKWQDLVTASLIGTERAVVPVVEIPGLARVAAPGPAGNGADPAELLLDRAALMTAARRAGQLPGCAEALPVCEPDRRPVVSQAAGSRLARMLAGERQDLLAEWLTEATARGLRPPPQLLPALLETARVNPGSAGWRRLVAEAGGSLARWLAALNPEWEVSVPETGSAPDTWRLGNAEQRRGYLATLRATDPAAARELLAASWDGANQAERAGFLSVLADGLSPADEPLLEAALDDRAAEVRGRAAVLLAGLPGSALGRRMTERARRCLRIEHGPRGTRLVTVPPVEPDASMRRDGIAPGPVPGRPRLADLNRFVVEILAGTPLCAWTDAFGLTAAQILAVPAGDWTPVLFAGWSRAAVAQRDRDWTAALIGRALTGWPAVTPTVAEALKRLARRADPSLGAPGALAGPGPDAPPAVRSALNVLRFRHDMRSELEDGHHDG
jgi:Family of unknown function (DUF5691)